MTSFAMEATAHRCSQRAHFFFLVCRIADDDHLLHSLLAIAHPSIHGPRRLFHAPTPLRKPPRPWNAVALHAQRPRRACREEARVDHHRVALPIKAQCPWRAQQREALGVARRLGLAPQRRVQYKPGRASASDDAHIGARLRNGQSVARQRACARAR